MEREFYVYKHVNKVNGKIYIGITCQKPKRRWNNGRGYIENKHFTSAIKKYGWNKGFTHEILYSGLSERQAEVMEVSLIAYYDSTDETKGYNISPGGGIQSKETRKKISEAKKGKPLTEEHKQKLSEALKGKFIGENSYMYGRTGYNCPSSKSVICITTGKCFGSTAEASRYYNFDDSNIRKCCRGERNYSGKLSDGTKLVWCFISDLPKPQLTEADKVHLRDLLNYRGISSAQA